MNSSFKKMTLSFWCKVAFLSRKKILLPEREETVNLLPLLWRVLRYHTDISVAPITNILTHGIFLPSIGASLPSKRIFTKLGGHRSFPH